MIAPNDFEEARFVEAGLERAELFLVRAERTVHKSDGCVAVEGRRFLCDSSLRGMKVVVRYDPSDLSSVVVFADGRRAQRAMPQPIGRVKDEPSPAPPAGPRPTTSRCCAPTTTDASSRPRSRSRTPSSP
ncbi:MAG: Mu transposase C-terminal domain-containing protein [Sandaracinaceae bacterium]|nr:Mu transposase C-terminal domain-containing protein [Sandaracinaceae bacterium]